MDEEMEGEDYIPDKLIPAADTDQAAIDDVGEETDVVKEKGGTQSTTDDNVVNGDDDGRVTENMDTEEPLSISEINMETEGVNAEASNDLEELATETTETEESKNVNEITTGSSEIETLVPDSEEPKSSCESGNQEISEQEFVNEIENFDNGQKDMDDKLNIESNNLLDDVANDTVDDSYIKSNSGQGSVEHSNDAEETFNVSAELNNDNESEEINKCTEDVLDIVEPLSKSEETEHIEESLSKSEETEQIEEPLSKSEETEHIEEPLSKSGETEHIEEPLSKSEETEHIEEPLSKSEETEHIEEPLSKTEETEYIEEPLSKSEETEHIEEPLSKSEETEYIEEPLSKSEETEHIEEPLNNQSDVTENVTDQIVVEEEEKENYETEVLNENKNIESEQIGNDSSQQISIENTEEISQDSLKSDQEGDRFGQLEDKSDYSQVEEISLNVESDEKDADDDIEEIKLEGTSEDNTDKPGDDIGSNVEDLTDSAIGNEADTLTETNQEIDNSLFTKAEADKEPSGDTEVVSPIQLEDENKEDIVEEDLSCEPEAYSEEKTNKDDSPLNISSSDAINPDIEESQEKNENFDAVNTESVEDWNEIEFDENKAEMEISEVTEKEGEEIGDKVEEHKDKTDGIETDNLSETIEEKGRDTKEDSVEIHEAMDVETEGNDKANDLENMDVAEISENTDAGKAGGKDDSNDISSVEQEKKEESKEEDVEQEEMITDTDMKDQGSPESDKTESVVVPTSVAVTNTNILETEQKSVDLSDTPNNTQNSASQSNSSLSSESDIQPITFSKSEVKPQDEISNQSEDKSNTDLESPGDNSNQSETVSHHEATPSDDNSNQTESSSNRKSPEFDMSSVKVKEERLDSTESDKTSVNENSQSGDINLKITDVVSENSEGDKGGQSVQTSDTVTAKGDNAGDKENIQDNKAVEKVKVKQELANKIKEGAKKLEPKDEEKKKVKPESSKGKEEEDDDVIAIKEEKKPVQKPKQSKIQTCIVCAKVGKCKYNIVRNGDVKHLCDDTCFKQFRSSPTTYLKQAETAAQAQSKPDNQSNNKPAPVPAKNSAPVKSVQNQQASFQQQSQVYKTCTVCQLMNVRTTKPFLNWQGLDYCGEECLGKYQAGLSNNCSYCSGAIFPNNKAKFCCRVGNEVKHFCSTNCNNDYVKRMKLCAFCNKDLAQSTDSFMAPVGETFKDFCSQNCLQRFEEKNSKDIEIVGVQKGQKAAKVTKGNFVCAVCGKVGPAKHEFKLDAKMNRLCSDPCFSAFQYANKLTLNTCDNCGTNLNAENQAPQYVQFEGQQRRFCSFMCVNTFRNTNKKTVPCAWCANKKSNFDMIERVDANNKYQLFCSLNCLSLYRVNLQATSNQAVTCDQCRKYVPAQYHLTMSDASVRNFCSYGCVMQFQAQFQTPAKQVPQQNSLNNTVIGKATTAVQQQQTTTRSGRVVTKAPKVAAAVQQQQVNIKSRGGKKDDSFPIISNVVSLAPQGTQQQVIKSTTQASVTNQDTGIKTTTTTTGNQTVQQQIIIQPPPPVAMKNKSMVCKPFTQTKATSCRPHTQIKEVQTDGKAEPEKYLIPIPVPIYCPTPLAMYSLPTPVLIPIPIPVPVPVFIPTTKKSANSILKQIKEIREKIPADPLEAELLMMAEAVAGKEEESSSSSEEEDNTAPPEKEVTAPVPPTSSSGGGGGGGELGEDMLQMALRMASEMTDEPVMDLENSLEPVAVNTEPPPQPKPEVTATPQPVEEEDEYIPTSARSRRSRGGNKRQSRSTPRRNPKRQKIEVPPQYHEATPSPPPPAAPPPDANFHLKYTYGVNAFKHWVIQKNTQIEQASKPGHGKHLKTFKTDILQCTADELNYSLCLFVKEVRKPNGEEYAVDSIYYLCLGIQQYLFENGRIDNIFTDFYYERFTEGLNEILTRYEPKLNHAGQLVCRIEEEHLWESKQLGAHSPHVLLNSLVYFNTKYFMLKTSEDHLKLSFTHIMKHWKKTASGRGSGTGPNAGRSVYLRYYCPTPQGKDNQKKKKEEMPVYEQTENLDNPLRCPVKLYEFYLSKCPESIKNRNDTFYLKPERSSVPDSPVWYSNQSINIEHLTKLLNRIRLVREIQEAHLHTQPIYI